MMRVAFRADASIDIGTGHVMRCLTLAGYLQAWGATCYFLCRNHRGNLVERIESAGCEVVVLPDVDEDALNDTQGDANPLDHEHWLGCYWKSDAQQCVEALADIQPRWLVVDHYGLDRRWELAVKGSAGCLLVIDDLADRAHECDLLLDQNLGRQSQDYNGLVPHGCKLLIGPGYALLRPEFNRLRDYSLARRRRPVVSSVFVFLGGIDKGNITSRVLDGLNRSALPDDCEVTVIMGQNSPWLGQVREITAGLRLRGIVRVEVDNMAQLMADSDLAIGGAGTTSWERCCLGVPSLIVVLAHNQRLAAQYLDATGAAKLLDYDDSLARGISASVEDLIAEPGELQGMIASASEVTDGDGSERVLLAMRGEHMS